VVIIIAVASIIYKAVSGKKLGEKKEEEQN